MQVFSLRTLGTLPEIAVCAAYLACPGPVANGTTFKSLVAVVDPYYASQYVAQDVGIPPVLSTGPIGAICFQGSDTLLLDVNTFQPTAEIDAVTVVRGAGNHIIGFSGAGKKVANAPYADGGMFFGPDNILFYTAYPVNRLEEIKPGDLSSAKSNYLSPLGIASSVGSAAVVPYGFSGACALKFISWEGKAWYSTYLSPDGSGTYTVGPVRKSVALGNLNWEGMAFIAAGNPLFPKNSVLVNADLAQVVYAFELDGEGDLILSTSKHFLDVSDPVGMTVDPLTGDVIISTEEGPLSRHITVVQGFSPYQAPPTPSLSTSGSAYLPSHLIQVNFSNSAGNAKDWVGIYRPGDANISPLQWSYTDGTQTGRAGIINGNVTFASGLPSNGSYEARLFFNNTPFLVARTPFTVAGSGTVVKTSIFYNGSMFDNRDSGANASDDNAIAPDKVALRRGGTATFVNYSSYSRGINGIMVDLSTLPGSPSASDFTFKVGNDNNPVAWPSAPLPTTVALRRGAGTGGTDRVTLIWPDGAIKEQWLEVTVLADSNTGLASPYVFYFGSAIGETGNSTTDAIVDGQDVSQALANQRSLDSPAPIDSRYDFNRDKIIDIFDALLARSNQTDASSALKLINLSTLSPAGLPASSGSVVLASSPLPLPASDASGDSARVVGRLVVSEFRPGQIQLQTQGAPGVSYLLQSTANLEDTWTTSDDGGSVGLGNNIVWKLSADPASSHRYYRVIPSTSPIAK